MKTSKSIVKTVSSLKEAIEAAKEMGNDIFGGYENNIPQQQRVNDEMGVSEYFIMDTAEIFYIVEGGHRATRGQKMLNKVQLGSSLTSGPLCAVVQFDDSFGFYPEMLVNKSNHDDRRKVCAAGFLLTDPGMANAPREYNY